MVQTPPVGKVRSPIHGSAGAVPAKVAQRMTARLDRRAKAGDGEAFRQLTEPHRRELQVHCYRMLGSLQDAEDAVQDTLLAAWRGFAGFEGAPRSARGSTGSPRTSASTPAARPAGARPRSGTCPGSNRRNQPASAKSCGWSRVPMRCSKPLSTCRLGPEARYETIESISLAFVTALQLLPPRQLAVLVLRDVLGFHADEVAEMLDSTVDSANSALEAGARRPAASPIIDRRPRTATGRCLGFGARRRGVVRPGLRVRRPRRGGGPAD